MKTTIILLCFILLSAGFISHDPFDGPVSTSCLRDSSNLKYALIIVSNTFKVDGERLNDITLKQADSIANHLKEAFGFEVTLVKDTFTTKTVILQELNEFKQDRLYGPNSQLLVVLIGRGKKDRSKEYFMPYDAAPSRESRSLIPYKEIEANVNLIPCPRKILVIDALFQDSTAYTSVYESPKPQSDSLGNVTSGASLKLTAQFKKGDMNDPLQFTGYMNRKMNTWVGLKEKITFSRFIAELYPDFPQLSVTTNPSRTIGENFYLKSLASLELPNEIRTDIIGGAFPFATFKVKKTNRLWKKINEKIPSDTLSFCNDKHHQLCKEVGRSCTEKGRYYTWDKANTVCKEGWRLASEEDWIDMIKDEFQGDYEDRLAPNFRLQKEKGKMEKAFSELVENGDAPFHIGGAYLYPGKIGDMHRGYYWTSTKDTINGPHHYIAFYFDTKKKRIVKESFHKDNAFYCRCIQDESLEESLHSNSSE